MCIDTALVLMPKTSPNFDYLLQFWKDKIWLAGEPHRMQQIAISHRMNYAADSNFGFCMLTSNAPHIFTAARKRNCISHAKMI